MSQPFEKSLLAGGRAAANAARVWWRAARNASSAHGRRLGPGPGRGLLLGGCGGLAVSAVVASTSAPSGGGLTPQNPKRRRGALDFGSPLRRCTDAMLITNVLMFTAQWLTRDAVTLWGAKVNSLIAAGQWWRLLTSSLLHTSLFHLLINSHALHTIGPHLEMVSGRQRFAAVYMAGALVGTTASFLFTPAPSVGASAALFGLGAALGIFYWRHKVLLGERSDYVLRQLGITLAVNVAYSLANRRVDNWGHLGGMVGGAAVAWALGPNLVRDVATGRITDSPPLPLMAHQSGTGLSAALGPRLGSMGDAAGDSSGSSTGRHRRSKSKGKREQQHAHLEQDDCAKGEER